MQHVQRSLDLLQFGRTLHTLEEVHDEFFDNATLVGQAKGSFNYIWMFDNSRVIRIAKNGKKLQRNRKRGTQLGLVGIAFTLH